MRIAIEGLDLNEVKRCCAGLARSPFVLTEHISSFLPVASACMR